ncbi:basement membrane-specific heparan sulfate proteoglycan core protein-like isoform X2 [Carcharodon carcharias]|uniref:basement membrane-specific heparan sulfate proteoglycan core protein-like isoform X2 n=1 Tax=Carcharodon carcharias TaxID=13397 RepID=UPI001B7E2B43|nr:basement membrane-specific heparan sulfate proteoglycan core protein-like isoform X2 [Carcharodon carcharias]
MSRSSSYWNMERGFSLLLFVAFAVQWSVAQSPPSNPVISLDQQTGVYVVGERVTITCTVTGDDRDKTFQFYRGHRILSSSQLFSKNNIGTAHVIAGTNGDQYSCAYSVSVNGRRIDSPMSQHVMVTITDRLRKPRINLNQWTGVYVIGETVDMTCTVTGDDRSKTFSFYKDDALQNPWEIDTEGNMRTFPAAVESSEGLYQCEYTISIRGRHLTSPKSEAMTLTTTDPLKSPVISLDQTSGVYKAGERITMTCTETGDNREKTFYFFIVRHQLRLSPTKPHSNTLTFQNSRPSHSGQYQCQYRVTVQNRQFYLKQSQAVKVAIADPLKTPVISLDQTTGVYTVGERITMTCTVTGDNREKTFYFYNGHQQLSASPIIRNTNTLTFQNSRPRLSGQYQCQYRVTFQSRQFDSKQSQAVTVTIAEKKHVALAVGVASAVGLILLLALLSVCLWTKGKKQSNMENRNAVPPGDLINENLTCEFR